ncbi:hypothetical protein AB0H92_29720 [Streptomyces phaeochromogenes]|uniref:hypothetical protein n=1 Tax=Streptomyces phaeochromogenes TaxID=1923 RepID=UPI0033E2AA13
MRPLSASEQNHLNSLDAILECDALEVDFSEKGHILERPAANPDIITFFQKFKNVALGSSLRECNIWFTEISCRWRTREGSPELGGEFRLRDLYDSILLPSPRFTEETASERDLEIFSQLRVVDFPQHAGTGQFAAIRIQDDVDPLEMWYYDMRLSTAPGEESDLIRMEVSYCEYLDALVLTKGVFGWQYLFADISLRGIVFRETVARLERMLELFPTLFPDHDYGALAARLEARR